MDPQALQKLPSHSPGWRLTATLAGALLGDLVWSFALLGTIFFEVLENYWPALVEAGALLNLLCGVIAFPVGLGGWFFVWGDNGPPYDWLSTAVFHFVFGLTFYALIGAVVGVLAARRRRWQLSTRTTLVAFGVIAVSMALAAVSLFQVPSACLDHRSKPPGAIRESAVQSRNS